MSDKHTGMFCKYLLQFLVGTPEKSSIYDNNVLLNNSDFGITMFKPINVSPDDPFSQYSMIYLTIKNENFTDETYTEFLTVYANLIRIMDDKYYMIIDTFQMTIDNKSRLLGTIKTFTQVNRSLGSYHLDRLLCTSVIISSPIINTFINSVMSMFYKPLRPLSFVSSADSFANFLQKNLEEQVDIYASRTIKYDPEVGASTKSDPQLNL